MKSSTALLVAGVIGAPSLAVVSVSAASAPTPAVSSTTPDAATQVVGGCSKPELRLHIQSLSPSANYVSKHDKNGHCAQA